jgi:lysine---8-amino-7-oxononanoate aminotransferase
MGYHVTMEMRKRGMLTRPFGDVIVFTPPLVTSDEQIRQMVQIMKDSIVAVTEKAVIG